MSATGGGEIGWAVVHTHAHKEGLAVANLERQKFTTYCPKIVKRVRHARRFADVYRPLFPGYVFVALDPAVDQWRPILSTFGVRDLIRNGVRPNLLDPKFIEAIKTRESGGVIARPEEALVPGQEVKLSAGYFAGLTARILQLDQNERVTVLLNLLHSQVKAKLQVSDVSAVSA